MYKTYWIVVPEDELYHHGIKGQKWGVTNGPPYPLDASDHNASEKRAGWRSSLNSSSRKNLSIASRVRNVKNYGWHRGHAMNVANKLYYNVNTERRRKYMDKRQKESLKRAEKYWNDRAQGKKTGNRNIVSRFYDDARGDSFADRAIGNLAVYYAKNFAKRYSKAKYMYESIGPKDVATIAAGAAASKSIYAETAKDMAVDEMIARVFGHY